MALSFVLLPRLSRVGPDRCTTNSSVSFAHPFNRANQRIGQSATDNSWINYPAATPATVSYGADALNQYTADGAVTPSKHQLRYSRSDEHSTGDR
jgi:hypothetical protein